MNTKETWRIKSEKEFLEIALDYVAPLVGKMRRRLEDGEIAGPKAKLIAKYFEAIDPGLLAEGSSIKAKAKLLKILTYICVEDTNDWSEFSLNPESSLDDIMLRILINVYTEKSFVCYSYITKNPNINDQFVKDVNYVTSSLFKFKDWDDKHVDAVNNCMNNELNPLQDMNMVKLYPPSVLSKIKVFNPKIYYSKKMAYLQDKTPYSLEQ